MSNQSSISPAAFGQLIGHDRDFVMGLINAGEIVARDERSPGAKIPRWRIDTAQAESWRQSRTFQPKSAAPTLPRLVQRCSATGILAARRAARRERSR